MLRRLILENHHLYNAMSGNVKNPIGNTLK